MTRDEAIRRAEIAMAWARGEAVQFRTNSLGENWLDAATLETGGTPAIFRDIVDWRIKPKPLECWVWLHKNGGIGELSQIHNTPDWAPSEFEESDGRWVRMREVTEE